MFEVSVIIPLYNQAAFTKMCYEYLIRNTVGGFEIVFVDNASSDGTPGFLAGLPGEVRKISNRENLGFAKACNQGAQAARGNYLVFLNNDTAVHRGWLTALMETFRSRPDVAIAGPKLIYPDLTVQQAGVVFGENGFPYHLYTGCAADLPAASKPRYFKAVTGACLMISKRDFFSAGGFDEGYLNGLEDIDLCLKIGAMEKGIFYNPESVVTHFESRSENRNAAMPKNLELYRSRWGGLPLQDDYEYMAQDGMDAIMMDGRLEFMDKASADRVFGELIVAGTKLEESGNLAAALEHYRRVFDRAPVNQLILVKLEELSRKVGLVQVAENFRQRINARIEADPSYGKRYRPFLKSTALSPQK
jgi:GT2 family glycosyltransferase